MKKLFLIGLKDVKLAFRDLSALLMMLLAPFLLTLGLGFVTGSFSGSDASGVSSIPVILINQDGGQLSNALVDLFNSDSLQDLLDATEMDDIDAARLEVDKDNTAAVIVIPPGFTDSIIPNNGQTVNEVAQIQVYTNPTSSTGVGVIETILEQFINQVEATRIGGVVTVTQLLSARIINAEDAIAIGQKTGEALGEANSMSIAIKGVTNSGSGADFNALAYMAPGMALMFLMYTASYGGRTLLNERYQGTLPRLLVSPTSAVQVLGGKIFGTFLTGTAQILILVIASALLFHLQWGDPMGVLVLILAAVFAAVGWGMLITSVAKTSGQVQWMGMVMTLMFGLLGGSFFSLNNMPDWFRLVSKITPNAWGIDGFTTLAHGGNLTDINSVIVGLLIMGAILFIVSVLLFRRENIAG